VFSAAGRSLLDRERPPAPGPETAVVATGEGAPEQTLSVMVFALGEEWFALPTVTLARVVPSSAPHRIPHRHNQALLGLVNVDGELMLCVSLASLLGVADKASQTASPRNSRQLVVEGRGQRWVVPVTEVIGVHLVPAARPDPLPVTLARAASSHSTGVVMVEGHHVALLDPDKVLSSLAGSAGR
jgi:chemotaxis-related protein WspD